MLAYICRRTILESAGEIRETEIGTEVFGRSADFDPAHDTIVRVQMSQLRKRIARYFEEEGLRETLILEIAKGNYAPVFRPRVVPAAAPLSREPKEADLPVADPSAVDKHSSKPRNRLTLFLFATIVILLAIIAVLIRERARVSVGSGLRNAPSLRMLWSQMLNPAHPTRIVVADTSLAFLTYVARHGPVRLSDYIDRSYVRAASDLPSDLRWPTEVLLGRQYTGIADAELTADVVGLAAGSGVATSVVYSRNFNVRQFHSANVVLVGSRISNPWVEIFEEKLTFRLDLSSGTLAIRNQHPLSGEQELYRNSSGTGQPGASYGVIAFLPNPDRTGNVLVIAGLDMEATEGAGQFLSAEESFAPFAASLTPNRNGALPYFEGLVRTTKMAGAAENLKVVAYHRLVF
jgi:hypothetical protein